LTLGAKPSRVNLVFSWLLLKMAVRIEDTLAGYNETGEDMLRPNVCAATKSAFPIFGLCNEEPFARWIQQAVEFSVKPGSLWQ
jgi:hypothetical protein